MSNEELEELAEDAIEAVKGKGSIAKIIGIIASLSAIGGMGYFTTQMDTLGNWACKQRENNARLEQKELDQQEAKAAAVYYTACMNSLVCYHATVRPLPNIDTEYCDSILEGN